MRSRLTLFAIASLALAVAGCGSDSTGPSAASFIGRFALVSVNGATLPLVVYDTPTLTLTVTGGALTLNADKTFVEEVTTSVTANGFPAPPLVGACTGTYQRNGNTLTMTATRTATCNGGIVTGTFDGSTITVVDQASTVVFRR